MKRSSIIPASERTAFTRLASVFVVVGTLLENGAAAGDHGFADQPGGGAKDPRIEVLIPAGSSAQPVVFAPDDDDFEPCGVFHFDSAQGLMTVDTTPPTLSQALPTPANAWIALRFPFVIAKPKVAKTIVKNLSSLAPTSFLTTNVTFTDENGSHVPCIVAIGGKIADGSSIADDGAFPVLLDGDGDNVLASKRTLLFIADGGEQSLAAPAQNFAPKVGQPDVSEIREIRIRVEEVGGIAIHGSWVIKIGNSAGLPLSPQVSLSIEDIAASKPVQPPQFMGGNRVVKPNSSFLVRMSEPLEPWSIGISKTLAKQLDFPFKKNLGVTKHPCFSFFPHGDPVFPGVRLRVNPVDGPAFNVPIDVRPTNPNNLAEFVVDPLISLPKGMATITVFPLSANSWVYQTVPLNTAATSLYGVAFDDTMFNQMSFAVDG